MNKNIKIKRKKKIPYKIYKSYINQIKEIPYKVIS